MESSASLPLVSVVLPFRDAETTLEESLHSILLQSLPQFELLAVDDGSRDNSVARIVAMGDNRIRLIQGGRNGLVAALNRGLQQATTPFIARMDADDRMYPNRLQAQRDFLLENPEIDLVASRVRLFPEHLIQGGFREYIRWQDECLTPEDIAAEIYWESPVVHPSVMFRRDRILDLGGYHHGPFPEDYELWLRLHQNGGRMAKLPQILLDWREGPERLTRTDNRYSRLAFDRLRAQYLAQDPRLATDRPLVVWGAGRPTRKRVKNLLKYGFQVTAWVDVDPRKVGHVVSGAPVVMPEWLDRPDRPFVLSYVLKRGAREDISSRLNVLGYRRGRDFLMVG